MRLVSYMESGTSRVGWIDEGVVWDLRRAQIWARERGIRAAAAPLPASMAGLLAAGREGLDAARELAAALSGWPPPVGNRVEGGPVTVPLRRAYLYPPVPEPGRLWLVRPDGEGAGLMPSGMQLLGSGLPVVQPPGAGPVEVEVYLAGVVGRPARDLAPGEAGEWIAGLALLGRWVALSQPDRVLALVLGPWLTTPDELGHHTESGSAGLGYGLEVSARVGRRVAALGHTADLPLSLGAAIARASAGPWLRPGDLVAVGPVLSIGGTESPFGGLRPGVRVEVAATGLGSLVTPFVVGESAGGTGK